MHFTSVELISYISLVIILVLLPGPNMLLVTQSVGLFGKQAGFFNVLGFITALYIHAVVFALGLSVIMVKSSELFHLIRIAGALYIIYIGLSGLCSSWRIKLTPKSAQEGISLPQIHTETPWKSYTKGLVSCVLNPKAALFFLSFFPQFIHYQYSVLTQSLFLTLIWTCISATWYSLLILFLNRFRTILESQRFKKYFGIITGSAIFGIGIKIAISDK